MNLFWTNIAEDAQTIVALYSDHATSEQYHSEIKTDLNFERLASGKYIVNKMLLATLTNAYNLLRINGHITLLNQIYLPEGTTVNREIIRIKAVLRDVIYTSSRYMKKEKTWYSGYITRILGQNYYLELIIASINTFQFQLKKNNNIRI